LRDAQDDMDVGRYGSAGVGRAGVSSGRAASKRVTANAKGVATLRLRGRPGAKLRAMAFADDGSVSAAAKKPLRLR
jgi:hypothetical protein